MNSRRIDLSSLSNHELVADLKSMVERERAVTLALLRRLIEVERRKIHLEAYSSLFTYCIDCLGYSRSAACRRIQAARCLQRFPAVEQMLFDGRLNLTTVGLIARVISQENAEALLGRVAGQTQGEVQRVVASYGAPVRVRDRIRPVRAARPAGTSAEGATAGATATQAPTGEAGGSVDSPKERHAPKGAPAPSGAEIGASKVDASDVDASDVVASRVGASGLCTPELEASDTCASDTYTSSPRTPEPSETPEPSASRSDDARRPSHRAGESDTAFSAGEDVSFRVEFAASASFVAKFQRARSLVSRSRPGVGLADVFEAALDEYLKKHDPAEREARREARRTPKPGHSSAPSSAAGRALEAEEMKSESSTVPPPDDAAPHDTADGNRERTPSRTRKRPHIPAAVRDQVWIRDGGQCSHVGSEGRCPATTGLHVDHKHPHGQGGETLIDNLGLLCSLHNQFHADLSYGKEFMSEKRRTPAAGVIAREQGERGPDDGTAASAGRWMGFDGSRHPRDWSAERWPALC